MNKQIHLAVFILKYCIFLLNWVKILWNQEVSKFINHCNEIKAATLATKDGGQLGIIKPPQEPASK